MLPCSVTGQLLCPSTHPLLRFDALFHGDQPGDGVGDEPRPTDPQRDQPGIVVRVATEELAEASLSPGALGFFTMGCASTGACASSRLTVTLSPSASVTVFSIGKIPRPPPRICGPRG